MVNVIIHLRNEFKAEELVKFLLQEKLIASASIDENNTSYTMVHGNFQKEIYSVITAKSKSLLLNNIIKVIEERTDGDVLINALPIVGSNKHFDDILIENTIRI